MFRTSDALIAKTLQLSKRECFRVTSTSDYTWLHLITPDYTETVVKHAIHGCRCPLRRMNVQCHVQPYSVSEHIFCRRRRHTRRLFVRSCRFASPAVWSILIHSCEVRTSWTSLSSWTFWTFYQSSESSV